MDDVRSYVSPRLEVRRSDISGRGLFAKERINKGEIVFIKAGHIVSFADAQRYRSEFGDYSLQISDEFFLSPISKSEVKMFGILFNHSCDPNAGPEGNVVFVAIKDICPGEEITVDYASINDCDQIIECCYCGSKLCRGKLNPDDWKRRDLQERYGDNFSDFILKKIKKLKK